MPVIKIIEHIDASPEVVWNFISDVHRGPEWVTVMKDVLYVSEGEFGQGSIYRELSKIGPKESETEWHITRFEPPHVQVHECQESTLQATLTMRVEPDGNGARLIHQTEYQLMPVFRPLGWVLEKLFAYRMMRSEFQQSVQNAKQLIEREYVAAR